MVTVIVAVITGLMGIAAGSIPYVFTSERRRLLQFVKDEAEALDQVKDERASELLGRALRVSARRYRNLAVASRSSQKTRETLAVFAIIYPLAGVGALVYVNASTLGGSDRAEKALHLVGGGFVALMALLALVLTLRVRLAKLDDSRERGLLAAERAMEQATRQLDSDASQDDVIAAARKTLLEHLESERHARKQRCLLLGAPRLKIPRRQKPRSRSDLAG